jgi:hypothetical protein
MFSFELNNKRNDLQLANNKLNCKSPVVEIFNAIATGQDLTKFGTKVDTVMNHVKDLAQKANNGDFSAKAEINSIVRFAIEPKLTNLIQLFSFMGTFRDISYDEQAMLKTYKHDSIRSNFQASQGDVPFAVTSWEEYPVATSTISAGYAVNYREIASGNLDKVAEGMNQVQIDMMNKAMLYVVIQMYNAIKNATGVKYFAEANGIVKTSVDDVLKKVRRFGKPAIAGDYSVISQLSAFAGYASTAPSVSGVSQTAMDEIRQNGALSVYGGSSVVELPNQYNLTQLNAAGDNFKTYLPEGLLFFVPQGALSPLQVFRRGGLTSQTGNDIVSGTELTRFDMEIGAGVAKGREFEIGLLSDTNFSMPTV